MFARIATSALIAGAAAGLIAALLQLVFVQPVLLHAELYEGGDLIHFTSEPAEGGHDHGAAEAPAGAAPLEAGGIDFARDSLSVLFSIVVYVGYGLLLVAAFALAESRGHRVGGTRQGILWGLAGFVAVQFAPAAGLPPELPGMAAADLALRQLWWAATVAATGVGLWLIAFGRSWGVWALAIALIALPHIIGAPNPHDLTGPTPPELASLFAGRALGVGLAVWTLLGLFAAGLWTRDRAALPAPQVAT